MGSTTTKFWLHPITMSVMIAGTLLFVALGGNIELLWIPGAAALGAAIGSDWSRASGSRGVPEVDSTASAIEPELAQARSARRGRPPRREREAA